MQLSPKIRWNVLWPKLIRLNLFKSIFALVELLIKCWFTFISCEISKFVFFWGYLKNILIELFISFKIKIQLNYNSDIFPKNVSSLRRSLFSLHRPSIKCTDGTTCYRVNGRFHKHLNKTLAGALGEIKIQFSQEHILAARAS